MFVITSCNKTYQILNNGIGNEKLLSKEEVIKEAEHFDNFSIFNISDDDIELVDPSSIGIDNTAANLSYNLYKVSNDNIFNKIEKIATTLPKDLSDFLQLIIRQAKATTYVDVDSTLLEKEYQRALKINVSNPHKVATMSVLLKK